MPLSPTCCEYNRFHAFMSEKKIKTYFKLLLRFEKGLSGISLFFIYKVNWDDTIALSSFNKSGAFFFFFFFFNEHLTCRYLTRNVTQDIRLLGTRKSVPQRINLDFYWPFCKILNLFTKQSYILANTFRKYHSKKKNKKTFTQSPTRKRFIAKSSLFKYTKNFTTPPKKRDENFQTQILIFFKFLLKTWTVGTR